METAAAPTGATAPPLAPFPPVPPIPPDPAVTFTNTSEVSRVTDEFTA